MDIVFIDPPFVDINSPAFGLSLLKNILKTNSNYTVHIFHANLYFSNMIQKKGINYFQLIDWNYKTQETYRCCESIFLNDERKFCTYIDWLKQHNVDNKLIKDLQYIRTCVPEFLEYVMLYINQIKPKIVGCSNNFTQTNVSLKLLQMCSEQSYKTIIGGYNCLNYKKAYLSYNFIDECIEGECESSIIDIINNLLCGKKTNDVALRDKTDILPDYDDYIQQYNQYYNHKITLFYERSRGCLYAQQNKKCTFCLLDENINKYRYTSTQTFTNNVNTLYNKYKIKNIFLTDLMLSKKLLNEQWNLDKNINILCHIRPDLDVKTICFLRQNNIKIVMCGIETLSSTFLKQFNKGSSIIHIIELLKFLHINGIHVLWYIIQNIPLEQVKDYQEMLNVIPYICHLYPPTDLTLLRYETKSIYKANQEKYDICLQKNETITMLYDDIIQNNINYNYIDKNYKETLDLKKIKLLLKSVVEKWQDDFFQNKNKCMLQNHKIYDSRSGIIKEYPISIEEEHVLKLCYVVRSKNYLISKNIINIDTILKNLINKKLIYTSNDKYISLPIIKKLYNYDVNENLPYVL